MKYFRYFVLFFFLLLSFQSKIYSQNYQLVWSDEFDSPSLDLTSWTRETGGTGWGNNELEYYTNRDTNSYLQDGYLVIKAKQESFGGKSYTSARLKTEGKRFWQYGKIEAKMKLPYGQGIWPAFWMLGETISFVGWPACGEIDIMEMIGGEGREKTVYGTAHWDNSGQHAQYGGSKTLSSGTYADDFHIYAIEWNESTIKWYIDNSLHTTISITPSGLSEFHQEFFIILNLAVGGNWPGYPDQTTTFPQYLTVDYVRVYQDIPVGVEDESSLPLEFNLEQNYPNPFNPTAIINFVIPQSSFVNLTVNDVLGNEVVTLVNETKSPGKYQIQFDGSNLPSGVYFYSLSASSHHTIKKMVLLK